MKGGQCPKCGSSDVYTKNNAIATRQAGNTANLSIRVSTFSTVHFDNYICARCGYIEIYIDDKKSLPSIISKWDKVQRSA